jgi:hypothetical protein
MTRMQITANIMAEDKDEPFEGSIPLIAEQVVQRIQDVLQDVTKHDEMCGFRINQVTLNAYQEEPEPAEGFSYGTGTAT